MSDNRITTDDLTDEQIEQVLNSRGFQKMLAYQKLADGIEAARQQVHRQIESQTAVQPGAQKLQKAVVSLQALQKQAQRDRNRNRRMQR